MASAQTAQRQQDTEVARRLVSASNVPILLHVYRLNKAAQGIYRQFYGALSSSNVAFPPVALFFVQFHRCSWEQRGRMSGRLIVLSNRLADLHTPDAGGLSVALGKLLREHGGLWLGWSGLITAETNGENRVERSIDGNVEYLCVHFSQKEHDGYYKNYANGQLWPLLHQRVDLAEFDGSGELIYRAVNKRFADTLTSILDDDDIVWAHDYYFITLAEELRAAGVMNRIGFFFHTPLPPSATLAALPNHESLFSALFAYDLVGFQSHEDKENFLSYVRTYFGDQAVEGSVVTRRGRTLVDVFPLGIDVENFRAFAQSQGSQEALQRIQQEYSRRKLLIGIDPLDYAKGIPHRVRGFGEFLNRFPELRSCATLIQVAFPASDETNSCTDIQSEIESLCGALNGDIGELNWAPVRYIHRTLSREELAGLYQAAQVALVTPLRDSVSLVAKEFVAAQNPDAPGVLVLSKFTGDAEQMPAALAVNPYDKESMAYVMHRALTMSLAERQERHRALMETISRYDARWLCDRFLRALSRPDPAQQPKIKNLLSKVFRHRETDSGRF